MALTIIGTLNGERVVVDLPEGETLGNGGHLASPEEVGVVLVEECEPYGRDLGNGQAEIRYGATFRSVLTMVAKCISHPQYVYVRAIPVPHSRRARTLRECGMEETA